MESNFSYRTIFTSLRPPKVVTLIDVNDDNWIDILMRIIEYYSQLWGGNYDLIVPTDGENIDYTFLEILKEYDPDYIYKYSKSLLDLKYINNEKYKKILSSESVDIESIKRSDPRTDEYRIAEWVEGKTRFSEFRDLKISPELKQKLLEQLNPFYERDNFIESHSVRAELKPSYPLTSIIEIFKSSGLERIINFKIEAIKILKLLGYSIIGSAQYVEITNIDNQKKRKKINNLFEINNEPYEEKTVKRENINDFLDFIYRNKYSTNYKEKEKLFQYTPFELTMRNLADLQLANQRRPEIKDTVVVIIGDKLEDFCLYYNLMKLKKDAIWLPYNLIKQESFLDDYLLKVSIAISGKFRKINDVKDMVFTSMTLKQNEIENILKLSRKYISGINEGKIPKKK